MTSDETLDLAIKTVGLTRNAACYSRYDPKAILRDLSIDDLGAVIEFLGSFKTAALYPRRPEPIYNVRGDLIEKRPAS